MSRIYPLCQEITTEELLKIVNRRFPEFKTGIFRNLAGRFVYIDKNAFCRIFIKLSHKNKNATSKLIVNCGVTVLGAIFVGPLWVELVFRDFRKEVETVMAAEIEKRIR